MELPLSSGHCEDSPKLQDRHTAKGGGGLENKSRRANVALW